MDSTADNFILLHHASSREARQDTVRSFVTEGLWFLWCLWAPSSDWAEQPRVIKPLFAFPNCLKLVLHFLKTLKARHTSSSSSAPIKPYAVIYNLGQPVSQLSPIWGFFLSALTRLVIPPPPPLSLHSFTRACLMWSPILVIYRAQWGSNIWNRPVFKSSSAGRKQGGGGTEGQCSPERRVGRQKPAKDITELWEELEKLVWECADVCSSWHNQMSSLC